MIFNQWYIILESSEVKKSRPLKVRRFGQELAVWRDKDGKVNCIHDKCCHRGASLSLGKIIDGNIECPFHGFIFGGDGKCKMIPANGKNEPVPPSMKVHAFETFEKFGWIWVWYGDKDKEKGTPFYFEELKDYSYSTLVNHWKTDYTRAIENQLDVVHLPFVHKSNIGRGEKTLVHGPVVEREGNLLTFYVHNVVDDGKTIPLRPDEIADYKKLFFLRFHFPNLWQNYISDSIRIVAAFVPVDNENCMMYVRGYQRIITLPLLSHAFNWLAKIGNQVILNQDKRVVETQTPKKSFHKMEERLIMGDKPIIEYRRYRQQLIDENSVPEELKDVFL